MTPDHDVRFIRGRLQRIRPGDGLDQPTNLPEGTQLELLPLAPGDWFALFPGLK